MPSPAGHPFLRRALASLTLATCVGGALAVAAPASADPSPDAWAKLRLCESSGNYHVVAGNGHYGAYQFDQGTWNSVGGKGKPQDASRLEQDYRALYLYRMRGWQPWTCARHMGLRNDADARSRKAPTYAEAAKISGTTAPTPAPTTPASPPTSSPTTTPAQPAAATPAWPGEVYQYGDCSPNLRAFQLQMNKLGSQYHFQGTGCYAQNTRRAVVALQRQHGIKASGILGPKTWAAAFGPTTTTTR